jgi:regulation of enolase protein 1 (concanavalin A-like superfamily)
MSLEPAVTAPIWLKVARQGDLFTAYTSPDGIAWRSVGSQTFHMGDSVLAGLAVTSHNSASLNTSTFQNATFTPQPCTGAIAI